MRIHKEGRNTIFLISISSLLFAFICLFFKPEWTVAVTIICSLFILFFLQFFRNPERSIERYSENIIYAPADGKIVVIEQTTEDEYFKKDKRLVSIFMSPLNVHVNRAPISGKVMYYKYHKGKFLVAWHPKSSTENERTTTVLSDDRARQILIRQIAGGLARRIVNYLSVDQKIKQGEDFGFIKLGSRVDLYLPLECHILVKLGETVKGNKSVIAEFHSNP